MWHFCRACDRRTLAKIQDRALGAFYCDKMSNRYGGSIHCTKQKAADLSFSHVQGTYIADLFQRPEKKYATRNDEFFTPRFNTVAYRKHTIRYTGPKLWNLIPRNIRSSPTLTAFKKNIRKLDLDILTDNCGK